MWKNEMSMCIFNSWIIFVDEVWLNKLDCEVGFVDIVVVDYDEFVFLSKLSN